jgi:NAD-dependent DNA ligase
MLETISELRKKFVSYLDYYYENINKDMTRSEYNQLLDEIDTLLDNMEDMYREVSEYGSSS